MPVSCRRCRPGSPGDMRLVSAGEAIWIAADVRFPGAIAQLVEHLLCKHPPSTDAARRRLTRSGVFGAHRYRKKQTVKKSTPVEPGEMVGPGVMPGKPRQAGDPLTSSSLGPSPASTTSARIVPQRRDDGAGHGRALPIRGVAEHLRGRGAVAYRSVSYGLGRSCSIGITSGSPPAGSLPCVERLLYN